MRPVASTAPACCSRGASSPPRLPAVTPTPPEGSQGTRPPWGQGLCPLWALHGQQRSPQPPSSPCAPAWTASQLQPARSQTPVVRSAPRTSIHLQHTPYPCTPATALLPPPQTPPHACYLVHTQCTHSPPHIHPPNTLPHTPIRRLRSASCSPAPTKPLLTPQPRYGQASRSALARPAERTDRSRTALNRNGKRYCCAGQAGAGG